MALTRTPDALATVAQAAQQGDENAFAHLVQRFSGPLRRYVLALGVAGGDADDVVQDAFVRVYRHLGSYDPRYAFSTWLYTIARRLAINHLQRRRPQIGIDSVAQPVAAPASEATGNVWIQARALLNERQFTALWLRYGEDRDLTDIARVLDITALNARVLIHRARTRLAAELNQEDA